ncbi:MAG: hypothetical protein ACK5HZ_04635 [Macellibacteroides fermentans]
MGTTTNKYTPYFPIHPGEKLKDKIDISGYRNAALPQKMVNGR